MKPSRALTSLAAAINQLQLLAEGPGPAPAAWSRTEILPGPLGDSRPSPSSSLMLSASAPPRALCAFIRVTCCDVSVEMPPASDTSPPKKPGPWGCSRACGLCKGLICGNAAFLCLPWHLTGPTETHHFLFGELGTSQRLQLEL